MTASRSTGRFKPDFVTPEDEDAVGVGGVPEDDGQDVAFELGGWFDAADVAGGESDVVALFRSSS